MANKPMIGSYKKPSKAPAVEDVRPNVETPTKALADGIQEDLRQGVKQIEKTADKAMSYRDILRNNDISEGEANSIVDDMLSQGFYEETVQITKKISVTFRTRTQQDYIRYLRALEFYNPKFVDEQTEIQIRYYLAASLVAFKGETLPARQPDKSEEDAKVFEARLDWLQNKPERLISLLANKLAKFDNKVAIVLSEGVVENF